VALQERQSKCVKLLPPPWHELQVIAGESEPSACLDPAAMGRTCVPSSIHHVIDGAPPVGAQARQGREERHEGPDGERLRVMLPPRNGHLPKSEADTDGTGARRYCELCGKGFRQLTRASRTERRISERRTAMRGGWSVQTVTQNIQERSEENRSRDCKN